MIASEEEKKIKRGVKKRRKSGVSGLAGFLFDDCGTTQLQLLSPFKSLTHPIAAVSVIAPSSDLEPQRGTMARGRVMQSPVTASVPPRSDFGV